MRKHSILLQMAGVFAAIMLWTSPASATCPTFHSLTNGTTASATDVMDNYNFILNCPAFSGPVHLQDPNPYDFLSFDRSASPRWQLGLNGATNGDMLVLSRFNDSGAFVGYALTVVRSNGDILINGGTKIIDQSGNLYAAHLKVEGVTSTGASGTGNILFGTSPAIASPTFSGTVAGSNTIPLSILAQQGANTIVGNLTGASANVTANTLPSCADSGGQHLNYVNGTGFTCGTGGSGGGVVSVFGRGGAVVAVSGDYTFAQIGSKPTTVSGYGITDAVSLTGAQTLSSKTLASPVLSGTVTGNNTIPFAILAQSGANTMLGNWTGATANVTSVSMPSCPDSGGNHLNYVSGTGITCGTGGSGGSVSSVFGRTGTVVATSGDYSVSQVTGAAPTASPTFTGTVTGPTFVPNGTTAPSNGIYLVGTNTVGISANSTRILSINTGAVHISGTGLGIDFDGSIYNALDFTDTNNGTGNWFLLIRNSGGTPIGGITRASSSSVAYNTTSDERLKNFNVPQHDYRAAIENLLVRDFSWRKDGSAGFGVSAQQAYPLYPFAIRKPSKPTEFWSADYGQFAPLALWGVKDIYKITTQQKTEIASLHKQVDTFAATVAALRQANDNQSAEIRQMQKQIVTLERAVRVRTAAK